MKINHITLLSLSLVTLVLYLIPQQDFIYGSKVESLAKDNLTLGVMAPLTGDLANYGQMISRGVEMSVQVARQAGIKVKVEYEDACLPKDAIPAVKRLLAKEIDVLAGSYCILGLKATAPEFVKRKVPVFQTAEITESIANFGNTILSLNIQVGKEAEAMAEHAYNNLNARTASVIHWPGDWGEEHAKYFSGRFKSLGGIMLMDLEVEPFQTDYKTEVVRINAKKPDVVYSVLVARGLGVFVKQLRYIGSKTQILTTSEAEERSVIDTAKGTAEGIQLLVPEKGATQVSAEFIKSYENQYREAPNLLTKIAYDSTNLAIEALNICKKDNKCFLDNIYNKRNIQGTSGEFSVITNKGAEKGFVLKVVRDGQFVLGAFSS